MPSVLFVCTGNQFRSPIAAQAFRKALEQGGQPGDWRVLSAGTWAPHGMQPPAEALRLARSLGLEIEAHRTRSVDRELLGQVDLILVMEAGQKEALRVEFPFTRPKLHLLSEAVEGIEYDIPDPAGAGGEARSHLLEMVELIRSGADRIMHLAQLRSRSGPAPGSGG